jgi:DNA-binding MarR family transcriptional regulator
MQTRPDGAPFSARDLAIAEYVKNGLSRKEIAERLNSTPGSVSCRLSWLRKAGLLSRKINVQEKRMTIPHSVWTVLKLEAKNRKTTAEQLTREILRNVVEDELFSAVLDK